MLARMRIFPCSACEHRGKNHRRFSFYTRKKPSSEPSEDRLCRTSAKLPRAKKAGNAHRKPEHENNP